MSTENVANEEKSAPGLSMTAEGRSTILSMTKGNRMNTKNKIRIESADDYELVAGDIFTSFLETFTKENGLIRDATDDEREEFGEDISYMYTTKGQRLADRMRDRLYAIGNKYWKDEFSVESHLFQDL